MSNDKFYRGKGKKGYNKFKKHNNNGKKPENEGASSNDEKIIGEETQSDLQTAPDMDSEVFNPAESDAEQTELEKTAEQGEQAELGEQGEQAERVEIIGIRFRQTGKTYYFDPVGVKYAEGEAAIVETARGIEYGEVALGNRYVSQSEITPPLRAAQRVATSEDRAHFEENKKKEAEALILCSQKIISHKLDMKLIGAEYTFDNTKLLFYFTSDGRVDFRELVKDLASVFRCRIELRQMGIRDEAKAMGGLGVCGRQYCCATFLPDFVQVSIKMAKEQNISLNTSKISGACGRLMCCLRYEYDTYLEEIRRTPKLDSIVRTKDGEGIVVETRPLAGTVLVRPKNDFAAAPKLYSRDEVKVIFEKAEKDDSDSETENR